eukprot:1158503-Pelagomonas_calceolata.AAC.3
MHPLAIPAPTDMSHVHTFLLHIQVLRGTSRPLSSTQTHLALTPVDGVAGVIVRILPYGVITCGKEKRVATLGLGTGTTFPALILAVDCDYDSVRSMRAGATFGAIDHAMSDPIAQTNHSINFIALI